jgi:hypothetical protein
MGCKKAWSPSRMSDSDDYDSENDSLSPIERSRESIEAPDDIAKLSSVRQAIQSWKVNEFDKTTRTNAKGLGSLRHYTAKAARLFYDIMSFLKTSKNNEQNMKDTYYVNIVTAIGLPGSLSFPLLTLLENALQHDLLELPYTIQPNVVNAYAKDGMVAQQEFPEEE